MLPRGRTGGNELRRRSWAELVGGSRGRGGGSRAATAAAAATAAVAAAATASAAATAAAAAAAAANTAAIGVARKLAYRLSQEALGALGVAKVTQ